MTKAILVIDKPRVCSECDLFKNYYDDEHEDWYYDCALLETRIDSDVAEEEKCDGCPLKPLPEKLPMSLFAKINEEYTRGRNDCIDEILGEENDT